MSEEKVYAGNGKVMTHNDRSWLKMTFHRDDISKMMAHAESNNGFVSLNINKRKEPSAKGYTHYGVLDTWKPKQQDSQETTNANNAFDQAVGQQVPF